MALLKKRFKANQQIAETFAGPQTIETAIKALKTFKSPKFDQSVEACVHLGIDPRQADQQLRGSISMPKQRSVGGCSIVSSRPKRSTPS